MTIRQDKRIAQLTMPDKSELGITRFDSTSGIAELFEHRIEAVAEKADIDFSTAIGRNATVTLRGHNRVETHFDGIVTEAQWLGVQDDLFVYRLVLRPWLWLLSHRSNSRLFHKQTAPQIIAKVFQDHGFAQFEDLLHRSYTEREYVVQYRETDMAFVCRLMEEFGIAYYFHHYLGSHTLVLSDRMESYEHMTDALPFIPLSDNNRRHGPHIHHWVPERRFTAGQATLNDYDFRKPRAKMEFTMDEGGEYSHDMLELYDHPGGYTSDEMHEAAARAGHRIMAERGTDTRVIASGEVPACKPGTVFSLSGHPTVPKDDQYLVLRASHSYAAENYRSHSSTGFEDAYTGHYEVLKPHGSFVPPRVTERPFVHGHQTARVMSERDPPLEIDVDEYGRILVQFFWDREKKISRRCRVAQIWSGSGWGGIVTPRVGMEVVVGFLEGDPNDPIVLGTVYNGENMPPYTLPEKKTISGVKSRSTPEGKGYNEFIFDDAKGAELVRVHAERDLDTTVKRHERRRVKGSRATAVNGDDRLDVGHELRIEAKKKIELIVGKSKITMTEEAIEIESLDIQVTAKAELKTKGLSAMHEAESLMEIKSTLVKIN